MHQVLHVQRTYIEQLDPAANPLTKVRPVQLEERVPPRQRADHFVGYARPFAQPRQLELLHFPLPAHVVHQKVGVPFSSYESHDYLSFEPGTTSNWDVVYGPSTTRSMVRCKRWAKVASNRLMPGWKGPPTRECCK